MNPPPKKKRKKCANALEMLSAPPCFDVARASRAAAAEPTTNLKDDPMVPAVVAREAIVDNVLCSPHKLQSGQYVDNEDEEEGLTGLEGDELDDCIKSNEESAMSDAIDESEPIENINSTDVNIQEWAIQNTSTFKLLHYGYLVKSVESKCVCKQCGGAIMVSETSVGIATTVVFTCVGCPNASKKVVAQPPLTPDAEQKRDSGDQKG